MDKVKFHYENQKNIFSNTNKFQTNVYLIKYCFFFLKHLFIESEKFLLSSLNLNKTYSSEIRLFFRSSWEVHNVQSVDQSQLYILNRIVDFVKQMADHIHHII